MEISIDLKLMREIVFKDQTLLNEMLNEWIDDSATKIIDIKKRLQDKNESGLFNKIHELKTNFSMIHCSIGIQFCERLIADLENHNSITLDDLEELNQIVNSVTIKLREIIK